MVPTALLIPLLCTGPIAPPADVVSFNRDVRPILADRCFACHGPDRAARQAGLRLDVHDPESDVIVPGDPDASLLIERISATDPRDLMPPPESHLTLTPDEREILRTWIADGATYEPHWSFIPVPDTIDIPVVQDADWPRDPLDHFVLHRLEAEDLHPSPEVDRARWLRRVTYDLTGLPPSIEELDAFLADTMPDADGRVLDRLLSSPHYGERMAIPWLDASRYADSYGLQSDLISPTWPWRDWVVRSFNDRMPYDEFLARQIAGDLRPDASRDDRLATAFNRLHRMTNEGGSIPDEWRIEYAADRVETFGTAMLGLTLGCARCHDHKYDPITQREYYQLTAYFNSIDEHGMYETTSIVPTPSLLLPDAAQTTRLRALTDTVRRLEAALPHTRGTGDVVGVFSLDSVGEDGALTNTATADAASGHAGPGASTEPPAQIETIRGGGLRLDGDNVIHVPGLDDIARWTPFSIAFWVRDVTPESGARIVAHRANGTDAGHYGFDLMVVDGRLLARGYRHWPGNAIAIETRDVVLPPGEWTHVVWSYDGSSRARGLALHINGEPTETTIVRDRVWKTVGAGTTYGPGSRNVVFGQRFRDRGLRDGEFDHIVLMRRQVTDAEARTLFAGELPAPSVLDEATAASMADLANARRALAEFENTIGEIMVMEELPSPRPTHVLARGQYDAPRDDSTRVSRDTPAALTSSDNPHAIPRDDRTGLADWLTSRKHPLTARVAVNRLWQMCFGRGLVVTSEDFGIQGSPPSHPELLDYLANEFMASGWDTGAMLRRIMLSATYRQDSVTPNDLRRRDPDNTLLARGAAWRLEGEMIRDTALAASGLLTRTIGGPPVHPYQPAGLWREFNSFSPAYQQGTGTSVHRRSLYTVWKRTAPNPGMITFDAPGRELCVARRTQTNTPMQALVLLNDPQFIEASRVLAERLLIDHPDDDTRLDVAFRRLATRSPSPDERAILLRLLQEQREIYRVRPDDAIALLDVGETDPATDLTPAETAAWTIVVQTILNADATVWRR